MRAFADHGEIGRPVTETYADASAVLEAVADAGVDLDGVFQVLEDEGVRKFADAWDDLTTSVQVQLHDKTCPFDTEVTSWP